MSDAEIDTRTALVQVATIASALPRYGELKAAIAAVGAAHDRRVTELLEANTREVERRREAEASVQNAITALQRIRALLDAGYYYYCPKDEVDRALATLRADRQGGSPHHG